jgi:hypothetical protein
MAIERDLPRGINARPRLAIWQSGCTCARVRTMCGRVSPTPKTTPQSLNYIPHFRGPEEPEKNQAQSRGASPSSWQFVLHPVATGVP